MVLKWLLAFVVICVILLTASFFMPSKRSVKVCSSAAKMVTYPLDKKKEGRKYELPSVIWHAN